MTLELSKTQACAKLKELSHAGILSYFGHLKKLPLYQRKPEKDGERIENDELQTFSRDANRDVASLMPGPDPLGHNGKFNIYPGN